MANLSRIKRQRMLDFLAALKREHADDESIRAFSEIENHILEKKYGLVWEEHSEHVDDMLSENIPVLTEDVGRRITSLPGCPYSFILEGDNLQSLCLLEKTRRGAIDLIYIDPPYNTGNRDFIYDDDYVEEQDSFRHSKWLSFMKERLVKARDLLSPRGVIFIQISDIELANLKCLCDEIFGEGNFLNILSVNMKNIAGASGGGEDKRFKKNCEFILVYAREYTLLPLFNGPYVYTKISDLVQQYRQQGKSWKYTSVLLDPGEKEYVGSTEDGDGNEIKVFRRIHPVILSIKQAAERDGITEGEAYERYGASIFQTTNAQSSIRTRIISYRQERGIDDDLLSIEYVPRTGRNRGAAYEQFYKGDKCRLFAWLRDTSEVIDGKLYKKDLQGTYWDATGFMKNVAKEGGVEFANGKKPVELLTQIIALYPDREITVLDFFAGSGTTGHAVLALNQRDGGKRQFILCASNEGGICENKTYARIANVVNGHDGSAGIPANVKYFKCDWTPRKPEDYLLSNALCLRAREVIELKCGIDVDGVRNVLILNRADFNAAVANPQARAQIERLWVNQNIIFSAAEMELLRSLDAKYIPREFFGQELKEAAE